MTVGRLGMLFAMIEQIELPVSSVASILVTDDDYDKRISSFMELMLLAFKKELARKPQVSLQKKEWTKRGTGRLHNEQIETSYSWHVVLLARFSDGRRRSGGENKPVPGDERERTGQRTNGVGRYNGSSFKTLLGNQGRACAARGKEV